MQPTTIIKQFNVAGNLLPRDLTGWKLLTINELNLERTIRRFREGIIVTNTGSPHRLANVEVLVHTNGWQRSFQPSTKARIFALRSLTDPKEPRWMARRSMIHYAALAQGRLLSPELASEMTRRRGAAPELVMGGDREWGLGVALDADGYGMGGLGGSFGWWSEVGQYAMAFLTGHIGDHDRGDRLERAVRETLELPPL